MLLAKYESTLEEDKELMESPELSGRNYLALLHRSNQKEILHSQLFLLNVIESILKKIKQGVPLRVAYLVGGDEIEDSRAKKDFVMARVRLRKYLQELEYYQREVVFGQKLYKEDE